MNSITQLFRYCAQELERPEELKKKKKKKKKEARKKEGEDETKEKENWKEKETSELFLLDY